MTSEELPFGCPHFSSLREVSVSRKQDVSPGESCPKAVAGELPAQPPWGAVSFSVTSSQVKVKSYSGLLFQRKLSARHGNLPGVPGCQERGAEFTELLIVPSSLQVLFTFFFFRRDRGWFAALFKAKMPSEKFLVLSWCLYKAALWGFGACQTCQA